MKIALQGTVTVTLDGKISVLLLWPMSVLSASEDLNSFRDLRVAGIRCIRRGITRQYICQASDGRDCCGVKIMRHVKLKAD